MEMDEQDAAQKLHVDMQQDVITCPMPAGSVLLMNAHSMLLPLFLHSTECKLDMSVPCVPPWSCSFNLVHPSTVSRHGVDKTCTCNQQQSHSVTSHCCPMSQ